MNTDVILYTDKEVNELLIEADEASIHMNDLARLALEHRTHDKDENVKRAASSAALFIRPLINALSQYQAENLILRKRLADQDAK